ncbi:MAG: hypothetical protein ACP5NK_02470 [Thermoplasmata archaeon]
MKEFDLDKFDEDRRFQIRLQVSLIRVARDLQKLSSDPSRYDEYIKKRMDIIKNMIGYEQDFSIKYQGNIIFPFPLSGSR